jgi:hypothetical protein
MLQVRGIYTRRPVDRKTPASPSGLFQGAFIVIILIALCFISTVTSSLLHRTIELTGISIAIPLFVIAANTSGVIRDGFFMAPASVRQMFTGLSTGPDSSVSPVRHEVRI